MQTYFLIALGAALGGVLRYWMSGLVQNALSETTFPFGTLTVNILGSFLLGLIIYFLDTRQLISPGLKVLLTVGFCGGFTTFSTFSYETISLIRDSEYLFALMNMGLNLLLTLFAVVLAYYVSKILLGG